MRRFLAFFAAFAGVLLALVLAELVFRLSFEPPELARPATYAIHEGQELFLPETKSNLLTLRDPRPDREGVRGGMRPDIVFKWCYDVHAGHRKPSMDDAGCVEVRINSDGMRGPVIPRSKPTDTFRIVVVGDSFTFGHGVRHEAAYPQRIAELASENGARCEVLNLGVPGFNARDVRWHLVDKGLAYAPDLVVYGFFINDIYVGKVEGNTEFRVHHERAFDRAMYEEPEGLAKTSRLYRFLRRDAARKRFHGLVAEGYHEAYDASSPHWQALEEHVLAMREAAEAAGAAFAIAFFPELSFLEEDYPFEAIHAAVGDWSAAQGIPLIDVLEVYRGRDASELWVHPTDHHPDEAAHDLAARFLLEGLREHFPALR